MILLLTIFMISVLLGVELITRVPPTLHTPLMSGANAISGITIVGALTCAYASGWPLLANLLGAIAVCVAMINIAGGYAVTDRMLKMFGTKERSPAG